MIFHDELTVSEITGDRFPGVQGALEAGVREGVAPGFVAAVWLAREPSRAWIGAVGHRRLVPSPQPLHVDTVFDLASVSKVFATATLAAILVERGWIDWRTELRALLPDYPYPGIQLSHLLSHTAGHPAWLALWKDLLAEFAPGARKGERPGDALARASVEERQLAARRRVAAIAPEARPGERVLYSDISFMLLGFALEEALGIPLDRAVERYVWGPSGLKTARYRRVTRPLAKAADDRIAATEDSEWRGGVLQGQVHDDNCWAMGGYAGHAGAFATAMDVMTFARKLVLGGLLTRETLREAWSRPPSPRDCPRTLGWDTPSGENPAVGSRFSTRTVGHLGYTGTSLWIDLEAGLAVALLSNRVHPTRENDKIRAFRPRFHEALMEDLA